MCHHRGYEYLHERERIREETFEDEPEADDESKPVVIYEEPEKEERETEPVAPSADD